MLFLQLAPLEGTATFPRHRRGGCQPGATPRVSCTHTIVRPERAEDSCAPTGRTTIDGFRNPGRCPGL